MIDNNMSIDETIKSIDMNSFRTAKVILYREKLLDMEYNLKIIGKLLKKYGINIRCYKNFKQRCLCFSKRCVECNFIKAQNRNLNINCPIHQQSDIIKNMEIEE